MEILGDPLRWCKCCNFIVSRNTIMNNIQYRERFDAFDVFYATLIYMHMYSGVLNNYYSWKFPPLALNPNLPLILTPCFSKPPRLFQHPPQITFPAVYILFVLDVWKH